MFVTCVSTTCTHGGQKRILRVLSSCAYFTEIDLSLNLELDWQPASPWDPLLSAPIALGLQACVAMPAFLHGSWGVIELRFSGLHGIPRAHTFISQPYKLMGSPLLPQSKLRTKFNSLKITKKLNKIVSLHCQTACQPENYHLSSDGNKEFGELLLFRAV